MWKGMGSIVCHHICITGFRQRHGSVSTGLVDIWNELRTTFQDPHSHVACHSWSADWDDVVDVIARFAGERPPEVRIYAYSWGAGHGAMSLARALQRRKLRVSLMVLCDPVYRSRHWWGRWLALVPSEWLGGWPRIVVPANVRRVTVCRQSRSLPRGHLVEACDPGQTEVTECGLWPYGHDAMDNAAEFRQLVLREARS